MYGINDDIFLAQAYYRMRDYKGAIRILLPIYQSDALFLEVYDRKELMILLCESYIGSKQFRKAEQVRRVLLKEIGVDVVVKELRKNILFGTSYEVFGI